MRCEFSSGVREYLRTLSRDDRRRIGYAIHMYATTGSGNVRKIQDRPDLRLRIGDWRVLFRLEAGMMVVTDVARRDKAYKS